MTQQKTRRNTAQKDAVRRALDDAEVFVSAQELYRRLDQGGDRVGLATVYRQLNALADEGEADLVTTGEEQLFRACRQPGRHHHHLICESCGTAVDILPGNEDWFARVAAEHGFTVTRHTVEIYGRCSRCQSA